MRENHIPRRDSKLGDFFGALVIFGFFVWLGVETAIQLSN
jgi:hypothetical protein